MRIRADRAWSLRLGDRLTSLADLALRTEPLWSIPALAFACTTLLWGLGWSWVGLVVAAAAFPLRRWRLGYLSHRTPFEISAALLFIASLVGLAVSPDRSLSLRALQSVVACILLYYSLVNVPDSAHTKWGFALAVAGVFAAALLAFRDGFTPPSMASGFGSWLQDQLQHLPQVPHLSTIANPVMTSAHGLAIALEMVLLPLIGLILFTPKLSSKAAAILASLPLLMLLLLFGSQGAWLAMLAGVVLLLVWRSRWAAPSTAVVLGLGYLSYRLGWIDPHSLVSQFDPSFSLRVRMDLWREAAEVIRHHPIGGCGLGCLGKYSTTTFLSPHSAYLQFYADFGLLGAIALFYALVVGGRMAVDLARAPRSQPWYGFAVGILAAAVAVGTHGLFEGAPAGVIAETADGYFYIVSPVFAILAGVLVRTRRLLKESTP